MMINTILSISTALDLLVQSGGTSSSGADAGAGAGIAALLLSFAFVGIWFGFIFLMVLVQFVAIALMIWMIIDLTRRDFGDDTTQLALWIILLFFTGIIGVILYYFMVMKRIPLKKQYQ